MVPPRKLAASLASALLLLAACAPTPAYTLADPSLLPPVVREQPKRVQEAYRFAVNHAAELETVPCYCGCVNMGHRNNAECYLLPDSTPDALRFDLHAVGCGVCVDITQDVMWLMESGMSADGTRSYIDAHYGAVGPGTDTPHPEHG